MTVLPYRYQLQNLQINVELDAYLDLCIDLTEAEIGLCLLSNPETMSFQLNTVIGANPAAGRCPDQIAWDCMNEDYLWLEADERFDELEIWLNQKIKNLLCVPIVHKDKTLGVIQLVNNKFEDRKYLVQKQANLLGLYLVNTYHLSESNQWSGRLQQLLDFIGSISASLDPDEILRMMLEQISLLLDAEAASLFRIEEPSGDAILHLSSRADHRVVENYRIPRGKGIINHVISTGETLVVSNVDRDQRHFNGLDAISNFETRSILAVSLQSHRIVLGKKRGISKARVIGGLEIINKMNGEFTRMDVALAEIFASQAATILQTATLYNEMEDLYKQLLGSLMFAVDAKDPYTEYHSQSVSDYAVAIGQELGLSFEMINQLEIGGLLHDVGKIGIPDEILKKSSILTREEYHEIYRHPKIGYKIMQKVQLMGSDVLKAIIEHHERLDGSGYPLGLRGDEISLAGRIVAVADVFHALTSERPYRNAMPPEAAFAHLVSEAGIRLDKKCVEALRRAYDHGKIHVTEKRTYY